MIQFISILFILIFPLCVVAGQRHYYISQETLIADTTITFADTESKPLSALEVRAMSVEPRRLKQGPSPAFIDLMAGEWTLRIRHHSDIADNIDDGHRLSLSLYCNDVLIEEALSNDITDRHSFASYAMEWDSDSLYVSAGTGNLSRLMVVKASPCEGLCAIRAVGQARIAMLLTEQRDTLLQERLAGLNPDEISAIIASTPRDTGNPTGLYTYLDREADPAFVRLGGRYRLAIVPDPMESSRLLILYMEGAEVSPTLWQPGMIKGHLSPTPFKGQYDLQWVDAHGKEIPSLTDAYAIFDPATRVITLRFPTLEASIRLAAQ
ncbi:MAG: hypothetical protein NC342_05155 [Pseudoflavonifractor sp.]|nr:hypothetical protein [Alloprevotella sp.]MCM1116907.1 hypothetical protein [Pseudoflavonifractor sp.]